MDYNSHPINVHTEYSYKEMKAFQKHVMKNARVSFTILLVFWLVILLFYCVGAWDLGEPISPSMVGVTAFWLFATLAAHGVFYSKAQNKIYARHIANGESFAFRNEDFSVVAEQHEIRSAVDMRYDFLYSYSETKTAFYLFLNPRMAHIVSKGGFITGTPEELRSLLMRYVDAKKAKKPMHKAVIIYLAVLVVIMVIAMLVFYANSQ